MGVITHLLSGVITALVSSAIAVAVIGLTPPNKASLMPEPYRQPYSITLQTTTKEAVDYCIHDKDCMDIASVEDKLDKRNTCWAVTNYYTQMGRACCVADNGEETCIETSGKIEKTRAEAGK